MNKVDAGSRCNWFKFIYLDSFWVFMGKVMNVVNSIVICYLFSEASKLGVFSNFEFLVELMKIFISSKLITV